MAASIARGSGRYARMVVGVGALALTAGFMAPAAGAASSHVSNLVVTSPSGLTEVDLLVPPGTPSTMNVTVALDPTTCQPALNGGLSYSVAATSADPTVATVPSDPSGQLQCTAPATTSATFTISAVACGSTSVTFDPVVANPGGTLPKGWQNKVGPVSVPVVVDDGTGTCGGSGQGTGDDLAAAPAVANAYLNAAGTGSTVQTNCKNAGYVQKGKFFRGALISTIAAWMPRPESIRNDTTVFPQDGSGTSWEEYVHSAVDALCGGGGIPALPPLPAGTWNNL